MAQTKEELDALNAELQLPVDPVSGAQGKQLQSGAQALNVPPPPQAVPGIQVAQAPAAVTSDAEPDYGGALDAILAAPVEAQAPEPQALMPDFGVKLDEVLSSLPAEEAPTEGESLLGLPGAVGRGLETGLRQIQAVPAQVRGLGASYEGDAGGQADAAADAAAILKMAPQSQVPDFTYVDDMSSLATYLGESVGQAAPQILATIATGGPAGWLAKKGMMKLVTDPKVAAKVGALVGGTAGAGVNLPMEAGGSGQEFYEKTGDFEWKNALAVGAVNSALEWVVPSYALKAVKDKAKTIIGTTAETALLGGVTEGVQELNQVFHLAALDEQTDYWSKETAVRVIDATLRGGIGEGAFGGAAKAIGKAAGAETSSPEDDDASWGDVLTYMRKRYARKPAQVQDDVLSPGDYGADFSEASKVFAGVRRGYDRIGIRQDNAARVADFEDAMTPRYVYKMADGKMSDVLTDTDLEAELATQPQAFKPEIFEVDLKSMNPAGVTAEVFDLPQDANDSRIFFAPSTPAVKRQELLQRYEALGRRVEILQGAKLGSKSDKDTAREAILPEYQDLVRQGLRVIPSRGSSFTFKGQLVGKKSEAPTTTGRTRVVVKVPKGGLQFQQDLGVFQREMGELWLQNAQPEGQYDVVAVDANKVNYEDVNTLPRQGSRPTMDQIWFRKDVSEEQKDLLYRSYLGAIQSMDSQRLAALRKSGIQVKPQHAVTISANDANFKRKLVRGVATPGEGKTVAPNADVVETYRGQLVNQWKDRASTREGAVFSDRTPSVMEPLATEKWKQLKPFVQDLAIKLNEMGKQFKLPGPISLQVFESLQDGPSADVADGVMKFPLKQMLERFGWKYPILSGDLKQMQAQFTQIAMHEFGHLVTLWNWHKLPAPVQQRVYSAYDKARLDFSLRGLSRKTEYADTLNVEQYQPGYSLTFSEWLAEQFRRAGTQKFILSHEGAFYNQVAEAQLKMAEAWRKILPEDQVQDLLAPSWEFSAALDYMQTMEDAADDAYAGKAALSSGLSLPNHIRAVEQTEEHAATVALIQGWRTALPADTTIEINPGVGPGGAPGQFVSNDPMTGKNTIRLWMGSLERRGSQSTVAHEATHAVWHLLTAGERQTLIAAGKSARVFSAETARRYYSSYKLQYLKLGLNEQDAVEAAKWEVDQEYAAWLVGQRFNGQDFGGANSILDGLIDLFSKVKNFLLGRGFNSVESIAVALRKGEIAARKSPVKAPKLPISRQQLGPDRDRVSFFLYDDEPVYIRPGPMPGTVVIEQVYNAEDDGSAGNRNYYLVKWDKPIPRGKDPFEIASMIHQKGKTFAVIELNKQGNKGYEVSWTTILKEFGFKETGIPYMDTFYKWVFENQLRQEARPSGHLMADGYRMWQRRDPASVANHVPDPRTLEKDGQPGKGTEYHSPNRILANIELYMDNVAAEAKARGVPQNQTRSWPELVKWRGMKEKVNPAYWKDPINLKAFAVDPTLSAMRHEIQLGEAEKGLDQQDAQIAQAVTGEESTKSKSAYDRVAAETAEGALVSQAESMVAYMAMNRYGENNPEVRRELTGQYTDLDKVSWISRLFFSIKQLAWRNQHITQLNEYTAFTEEMNAFRMAWVQKASETVKAWDKFAPAGWSTQVIDDQKARLNDMLFWATEMRYLPPGQKARYPTVQELQAYMSANRVRPETFDMYKRIEGDFQEYLNAVEVVMAENIRTRNTTMAPNGTLVLSQAGQGALAKLQQDMAALRTKPYFPMVRFGEWTITVRDPAANDKVVHFEAFASQRERDAAVRQMRRRYPVENFQVGRVQPDVMEFQGLPKPILDAILAEARTPGGPFQLTPQQIDWLESFSEQNAPEASFKKRWLKRSGTPGYSLDAMRAYSQYFNSGASYLARMAYAPKLSEEIKSLRGTLRTVADTRKRGQIVQMVEEHYKFLMAPAKDWVKFRSAVTLWQLGFSPAAAFVNITQTPVFTLPYFSGIYGAKAYGLLAEITKSTKRVATYTPANADPQFAAARALLVQMGKLETGAAPELAAYSQGGNLIGMRAGTKAQQRFRSFMRVSMWMFEQAERLNREIAFGLSWKLSEQTGHPHLLSIEQNFFHEITRLTTANIDIGNGQMVKPSWETAVRIIAAREAISRTQFEYGREYRPKFMRNPLASSFLVFYSYTQSALYAFGNNPGAVQLWLTYALLFGAMGLPGAEDLDEVLKAIARKMFGKDFSLEEEARKVVRDITQGTPFEETGIDLALHGLSRYSFGPGLLQEGLGIPQFDASANGSMGQVIPGLAETARAVGRGDDWKSVTAELARDVAGAGFGQMFPMLQALSSGFPSDDFKKWESVMPRSVKAMSKAYRYATEGEERGKMGDTVASFDVSDPDDLATIVAQGLGFTPTVVRQKYDLVGAQIDKSAYYTNSRTALMTQFYETVVRKDLESRTEVTKRIREFNREVAGLGIGSLAITADGLKQSMQRRMETMRLREQNLPVQKSLIPLNRQVEKLFPQDSERVK